VAHRGSQTVGSQAGIPRWLWASANRFTTIAKMASSKGTVWPACWTGSPAAGSQAEPLPQFPGDEDEAPRPARVGRNGRERLDDLQARGNLRQALHEAVQPAGGERVQPAQRRHDALAGAAVHPAC
jgi:hypothetical protein